ncbi:MAG TPA: HdeD family acid-resistance protein [Thermodesulfobacteriota bacterium]
MSDLRTGAVGAAPRASRSIRAHRAGFLILGLALIVCGSLALAWPATTTGAIRLVIGVAFMAAGLVKLTHTVVVKDWSGCLWQLFGGVVEFLGGLFIYLYPLKGAIAITLLAAIVLAAEGVTQVGLAIRLRPRPGWGWVLASGLVAVLAGIVLVLKLPLASPLAPGSIVGLSLLIAGCAYLFVAYGGTRARAEATR